MTQVMLVRPWVDVRSGGGCCRGEPEGVCLDRARSTHVPAEGGRLAEAYRQLRAQLPDVDVQVVSASNVAYLLPAAFFAARRRLGTLAAIREASRATTAGAVLVDGIRVGHLDDLGVDGVLMAARAETGSRATTTAVRSR
jgi:hypothetical protein